MDDSLLQFVWQRAQGCCEYCRLSQAFSTLPFEIDHIIALKHRGPTVAGNLALSCFYCNNCKHAKTQGRDPATGETVALYHPRLQRWRDHFAWQDSYTRIAGLTPTGRATVHALHLNRAGLINLRRALHAFNQHPPPETEGPSN